ncbi:MAG: hypothetical protein K8T25_08180, partial [Planctomycetia bacterium]|nr:hypothetical protein [Planctomycetia bacterium]
ATMSRIFFSLSILALAMMSATIIVGLRLGDLKASLVERAHLMDQVAKETATPAARQRLVELDSLWTWRGVHMLLGVGTALAIILVNSIAVTYFIGTGRWCREVVEAYALDPALNAQSQRIKRRSFPWAVLGMTAAIGVSALGAAADPGTLRLNTEKWVTPHLIASFAGLTLIAVAFFLQWLNILENHLVIDAVVAEVGRIRRERGLEA